MRRPDATPACGRPTPLSWGVAWVLRLVLLIAVGGWAGAARAAYHGTEDLTMLTLEELSDIEVVYAASGFSQKLTEAPSAVTIVSGEDVRHLGYRTLADVLADVRGVYVSSDRIYQYVGVRGFSRLGDYNGVFLVLINGHAMNDHTYGFAGMSTDLALDLDDVERIEVARGPTSSIYGTAAFLGVVNVITRPQEERGALEARVQAGSFGERTARLSGAGKLGSGVSVAGGATVRRSDGPDLYYPEYDAPETNGGRADGRNADEFTQGFVQLAWRDLVLEARAIRRQKFMPTGIYETVFNDPRTKTTDSRGYVDLSYRHTGRAGGRFVGRLAFDDDDYRAILAYPGADSGSVAPGTDYGHGQSLTAQAQYFGKAGGHNLAGGGEYVRNLRADQGNFDECGVYQDDHRRFWSAAVFGQDEFELAPRLRAHAALRLDHFTFFGNIVNPREALIWTPTSRDVVKMLHGTSFRAPNAYEMFYADPVQKAPRSLEPEKMATFEFVWDHELSPRLSLLALAFAQDSRDLIATTLDPADSLFVFQNVDRLRTRGVELEMRGRWSGGIHGSVNYTFQRSEDPRTGNRVANSPVHLARLKLVWPLWSRGPIAATDAQFTSERLDREGGPVAGYGLVNFTLTLPRLANHLELSASVYNVFDARYADPVDEYHRQLAIGQDGRTALLRLRLNH